MINDAILKKVVDRLGGDHSNIKLLGGFNDSVYEVVVNNVSFVLKFYLASQTSKPLLKGELDWISYLAKNGMNVAKPVFSTNANTIEEIEEDNSLYYYVLFEKVQGSFIDEECWEESLIQNWGQAMGKMHNLAKRYIVPDEGKIKKWDECDIIIDPPKKASYLILEKWEKYVTRLKSLPTSKDYYGLIHNDLHHKNIYFNNGEAQLFDFGDCEYNWFIYDIAISLYHAVQGISLNSEEERLNFTYKFLKNFMKGYRLENRIDDEWIEKIGFFLDYRRMYSYLYILKHLGSGEINSGLKQMLDRMKHQIENGIPYIQGFNAVEVI